MRRAAHSLAALALLGAAGWLAAGCTARADEFRHVTLAELPSRSTNAAGVWESAPWTGATWVGYPGHVTLRVDHDLGRRPAAVLVYLAFDAAGTGPALSAGDLARVVEVADDHVTIRNDTDGDYFVRLVLE